MKQHPAPPFDPLLWLRAWQETWSAQLWPGMVPLLRAQRLAALLARAERDSPLYAPRLRAARDFAQIAPVDKAELMQGFDAWATDRHITRAAAARFLASTSNLADGWLDRYLLWTSSGTSGLQGWFVQDAGALAAYDAMDALRLRGAAAGQPALGLWGTKERFAFVGATGHFAGAVSLTRLARIVPPLLQPAIVQLSVLRPLREVAAALQDFAPTVLITYPSAAEALARMQHAGEMALALREAWVGGEQLSALQHKTVQHAFGCTVRNSYGASECFAIAFQCGAGSLHVHDDWVILEPVDAALHPVPAGTLSHTTLVTNLANHVQPIIRYRLDDRVRVLAEPCACGSHFTRIEVQGRSADTLWLPDAGRPDAVPIVPLALETIIEDVAGVSQFQVIDRAGARGHVLELRFESTVADPRAAYGRCQRAIERYLRGQGVVRTRCDFCSEPPLREARSGKLRRVMHA